MRVQQPLSHRNVLCSFSCSSSVFCVRWLVFVCTQSSESEMLWEASMIEKNHWKWRGSVKCTQKLQWLDKLQGGIELKGIGWICKIEIGNSLRDWKQILEWELALDLFWTKVSIFFYITGQKIILIVLVCHCFQSAAHHTCKTWHLTPVLLGYLSRLLWLQGGILNCRKNILHHGGVGGCRNIVLSLCGTGSQSGKNRDVIWQIRTNIFISHSEPNTEDKTFCELEICSCSYCCMWPQNQK